MSYNMHLTKYSRNIKTDLYFTDNMTTKDIIRTINENYTKLDEIDIFVRGSMGRFCMDFIYENFEDKSLCYSNGYPHIVIRSFSDYTKLCNATLKLLDKYKYHFADVEYAVIDRQEDGSFRCIPVEGIIISLDNGLTKQISNDCEDGNIIVSEDVDNEQYDIVQQFVKAVLSASNTDWKNEFLVLGGEW